MEATDNKTFKGQYYYNNSRHKNMKPLSRKEKGEYIRDLYYNQGKRYHEIAKLARVSPRDIKGILNKDVEGAEGQQAMSVSSKAYQLFSENKSPVEVAIALNLREDKVSEFYKEFWDLKQLYEFNKIYLETRGDTWYLIELVKLSKAAGMNPEHAVRLMTIANNHLPSVEYNYRALKSEVASLEAAKQNSVKILQDYSSQVTALTKTFDEYCIRCEQEGTRLADLRRRRMRDENLLRQIQNNIAENRKTVEEKVRVNLSNRRKLLELVSLSVIESMRENPERYSSLIQHNVSASDYTDSYYNPYYMYMYGQQPSPQQKQTKAYFTEDYVAMLSEDASKLLEKLVEKLGDEVINDYAVRKSSSPSLPALPSSDEEVFPRGWLKG